MSQLPLPDEIIRNIYKFILPIFDYENHVRNIDNYNKTTENISTILHLYDNFNYDGDLENRLNYTRYITKLSTKQLKYLSKIKGFVKQNPKFIRPSVTQDFSQHQFKSQFEVSICEQQMVRLEQNLKVNSGIWYNPDRIDEIMVVNNINVIHTEGSLQDLIFACIVNNVKGFKTSFIDYITSKYYADMSIRKITENHIISFVNYYYSTDRIEKSRVKKYRIPRKKTLIKRLMRI